MPITVIPPPNVPDPMESMARLYQMYSDLQQQPLRMQYLQGQIRAQDIASQSAQQGMEIAQQDAANRQAEASRKSEDYGLERKQREVTAQGYVNAAQAVGLDPEALAALTANAPAITAENQALVVPPEVQKYLFEQRLAGNPLARLQMQKAEQDLKNDQLQYDYTKALIQRVKQGDSGASGKLATVLNMAIDNLSQFDKAIADAEIEANSAEPDTIAEFLKTSVMGEMISLDPNNPGNVWKLDPKTKQPIVDPLTGYKVPIDSFAATWLAKIPEIDAKRNKVEMLRARRSSFISAMRDANAQVADAIVTRFDNSVGIGANPGLPPGATPSPQLSGGDQLEQLVDMLSKVDAAGGSGLRDVLSDPELRLPPDPNLVDRWAEMAFPPGDGVDATKRAANIMRLKALVLKSQQTGTPGSKYGVVK